MTYRNSLRRGAPKPAAEPAKASTAAAPRKSARTAPARGAEEDNGDEGAHEPTGLTSDEGSDSEDSASGHEDEESEEESESESAADDDSDVFEPSASEVEVEDEDDTESVASEDIDATPKAKKRAGGAPAGGLHAAKGAKMRDSVLDAPPPRKRRKEEPIDEEEIELAPGQKIIGRIYPAPTTGLVPPGQISQNTMDFLGHLQYPQYNNREWFKSHEPWFRMAEKEYRDFVQVMEIKFNEVDEELPVLPPRDICHRIYRDVRFSSDKSPYKTNFGLTYGRAGRRGVWGAYHVYLEPGGHSIMACGVWQPEKETLAAIRQRILANPQQLRDVVSQPAFVKMFGPPKPHPQGRRQNIYGHNDELKVAPKGFDKTHPDIDLLRLRSITVMRRFADNEVTDPHFVDKLQETCAVMRPFVHCLNDMISPEEDEDL